MAYDDRSVKPMSASLMRARIATKILAGLYEDVPTMLTSAIRLMVELARRQRPRRAAVSVYHRRQPGVVQRPERRQARRQRQARSGLAQSVDHSVDGGARRRAVSAKRSPLRALAVFPSWDRLVIAVSPRLGVNSMEELIAKKPKMNVSIAVNDCVDFAIKFLLKAMASRKNISSSGAARSTKWCGRAIRTGAKGSSPAKLDMVIDEGMDSWGDVAVEHGMKFLSYSEPVLQKLEKFGFQRARLDHGRIDGINDPTTVVDFSGWPIVVHKKFPADLAYHIAGVLGKNSRRDSLRRNGNAVDETALLQYRSRTAGFSAASGGGEVLSGEGVSVNDVIVIRARIRGGVSRIRRSPVTNTITASFNAAYAYLAMP